MKSTSNPGPAHPQSSKGVSYKDAFVFGFVAAMVVFVSTIIFTQAWRSLEALGLCLIYTVGTFIVVSVVVLILHWATRNDKQHENTEFPVLK